MDGERRKRKGEGATSDELARRGEREARKDGGVGKSEERGARNTVGGGRKKVGGGRWHSGRMKVEGGAR